MAPNNLGRFAVSAFLHILSFHGGARLARAAIRTALLLAALCAPAMLVSAENAVVVFAGGCFWCMEEPFDKLPGVKSTRSGYMGGHVRRPNYQQVTSGKTGHAEVVEVTYDPDKVSFEKLLEVFWRQIDPTDPGGQFVDRGSQYRTAIFYYGPEQGKQAERSRDELQASGRYGSKKIVTEVLPAEVFYLAEGYHQDYYLTSSSRYKYYRYHSGRDIYLDRVWDQ